MKEVDKAFRGTCFALLRSMRRAPVVSEGSSLLGRLAPRLIPRLVFRLFKSELRLPGRFCSSWT